MLRKHQRQGGTPIPPAVLKHLDGKRTPAQEKGEASVAEKTAHLLSLAKIIPHHRLNLSRNQHRGTESARNLSARREGRGIPGAPGKKKVSMEQNSSRL